MKLSIVVPIFNEASTVRTLLDRVWAQPLPDLKKELVIVESNSNDGSREIVQAFVREKTQKPESDAGEIQLILQDRPKGKGNATREGIAAAQGDIILIQDADLEYDVQDYPLLLQPIITGKSDFVLGSRHLSAASWKIRKFEEGSWKAILLNFGGIFFHTFFNILYRQNLTDPTTMYKVFKKTCVQNLHFVSDRFDFDFELLGKLIRAGYVPLEVPVSYRSRGFEEGKKVRMFRDPLTWIRAIIRFRFCKL